MTSPNQPQERPLLGHIAPRNGAQWPTHKARARRRRHSRAIAAKRARKIRRAEAVKARWEEVAT